ncbi:hypothetical protein GCM10022393_33450 [Aquimarina addita]|uniref:Tail specific protease domain-containing protein n=2 Tax=Aquimarina addita TaxID=870485 RepID=A0ABP6UTA5_9FLAO
MIISCSNDDDSGATDNDNPVVIDNPNQDVQEFIWQGMNNIYLYKNDVANLADDRFATFDELYTFLNTFDNPEDLFDGLLSSQDRFSFLVDDYIALENSFSGISQTTGMDFNLILVSEGSDEVLGFVRYILPGTDAESKGITRGQFFSSIDGEQLNTSSDFNELFSRSSYEVGFVTIENGVITPDENVTLTQSEYTENPVLLAKTIDHDGQKIGYLMYNAFTGTFDQELNEAFANFNAEGVTELVLDLRYNGGGSVTSAVRLASMITGQFEGEVFSKEIWNDEYQAFFLSEEGGNGESLVNRFVSEITQFDENGNQTGAIPINSLNLTNLYVLTTDRTASASELIINGLDPYINVIQIGEITTGKFQASVTLYDADGFSRTGDNLDTSHTYAIQPLVLVSANKNDVGNFIDGLVPDVSLSENPLDLGTLGEVDEPFLEAALDYISNGTVLGRKSPGLPYQTIGESKMFSPTYQRMYIDDFNQRSK